MYCYNPNMSGQKVFISVCFGIGIEMAQQHVSSHNRCYCNLGSLDIVLPAEAYCMLSMCGFVMENETEKQALLAMFLTWQSEFIYTWMLHQN